MSPIDPGKAERLQRQAKNYLVIDGSLYRKSPSGILMKCVSLEVGRSLLQDIHSGMCCSHVGYKSMVGMAFHHGFYWPTAVADAQQIVRTCENCQFYARQIHKPAQELQTIPITWPFTIWGLDILGPFPRARGGYKFLFVAIDKFTK